MESGALERFTSRHEYIRLLPRARSIYKVPEMISFLTNGCWVLSPGN